MALEDLGELASAFDEFSTGFVDVKLFSSWVANSIMLPASSINFRARVVPSCRVIRNCHSHGVSSLSFLPHSSILVSAGFNDPAIKLWDPVAHRHRLVRPDCGPVVRWRSRDEATDSNYVSLPEEWTDTGAPYALVCEIDTLDTLKEFCPEETLKRMKNEFGDELVHDLTESMTATPVSFSSLSIATFKNSVVVVRCDEVNKKAAEQIDVENGKNSQQSMLSDPDAFVTAKTKTGFLYCLNTGELLVVESSTGFDPKYVLMDQETLLVSVAMNKPEATDDIEEARKVFVNRSKVRRVAYISLGSEGGTSLREVKASASEMSALSGASPTSALLSLGVRAVVFSSEFDDCSAALRDDEKLEKLGDEDGASAGVSGMRLATATVVSVNADSDSVTLAPESLYYPGALSQITVPKSRVVECVGGKVEAGSRVKYGVAASVSMFDNGAIQSNGASEMLAVEVSPPSPHPHPSSPLPNHPPPQQVMVSSTDPEGNITKQKKLMSFAVGRTTLRIKACDFDRSNNDESLVETAGNAFSQRFAMSLSRFRALSPRTTADSLRTKLATDRVMRDALRELQSAVIDEPDADVNSANNKAHNAALKSAFYKFAALYKPATITAAMFEVSAALSGCGDMLWKAEMSKSMNIGDVVAALSSHMKTCSRAYHVLAPLLLSTSGGGMGPLCESLASLVTSRGNSSTVTMDNIRSFVESSCSRILGHSLTVEEAYQIATGALLLPIPPFRASPEAFARSVGVNHHSLVFVGPDQFGALVSGGTVRSSHAAAAATMPITLDCDSFSLVMSTMNPMTVSKMQLGKLQGLIAGGFGKKTVEEVEEEEGEHADRGSYMQQYASLLAAQKVEDQVRSASELIANLGHAVRQRAAQLLLEGPLLSLGEPAAPADSAVAANPNRNTIAVNRARMHAYSPIAQRSGRGITAYDGWGWEETQTSSEHNGKAVCVLEVGADRLEAVQSGDKQVFSAHLIRIMNTASTNVALKDQDDLVKYVCDPNPTQTCAAPPANLYSVVAGTTTGSRSTCRAAKAGAAAAGSRAALARLTS
jgi:hypothetical protein